MVEFAFKNGGRERREWAAPPAPVASGRFAGLEMQDRKDRQNAPRRVSPNARLRRSNDSFRAAVEWARRSGFSPEQEQFAAVAAQMLREAYGEGRVTRAMVLARCQAAYPDVFGGAVA